MSEIEISAQTISPFKTDFLFQAMNSFIALGLFLNNVKVRDSSTAQRQEQ